jgi:predicted translin family RNA/ssDNA-binding protein
MKQMLTHKDQTRELLQQVSIKAVRSLVRLMQDEHNSERIRLGAARTILELYFRNCEFADIEESIAELRRLLSDLPPTKKGLRAA